MNSQEIVRKNNSINHRTNSAKSLSSLIPNADIKALIDFTSVLEIIGP